MTDETSDQRRLYVAHVVIEFDFAFAAGPEESEAGEVACNLINRAADELSSLYDYATVKVNLAAPAYEMPMGACDDDAVYNLRTVDGWSVKWRDAVENDKLLHSDLAAVAPEVHTTGDGEAGPFDIMQPDCPSGAKELHEAGVEPALGAPSDVVRLDYSVPPSGYTADGQWWSYPAPPKPRRARDIGPPETFNIAMVAPNNGGLAAAWAHYKTHNDPPGMEVWQTNLRQGSIVQAVWVFSVVGATIGIDWFTEMTEAQLAAWAWHDRRLALWEKLAQAEVVMRTFVADDVWPRILAWSDKDVAKVERWLVDSTVEMPEVLRG